MTKITLITLKLRTLGIPINMQCPKINIDVTTNDYLYTWANKRKKDLPIHVSQKDTLQNIKLSQNEKNTIIRVLSYVNWVIQMVLTHASLHSFIGKFMLSPMQNDTTQKN